MSAALATPALTMHKRSFSSPEMGALVDHEYPDPSPIRSHASERNLEQMGARLGDRQEEALVEVSSARAHRTFPETRGACAARDERGYRFHPTSLTPVLSRCAQAVLRASALGAALSELHSRDEGLTGSPKVSKKAHGEMELDAMDVGVTPSFADIFS